VQHRLTSVESGYERWNIKVDECKSQAIYNCRHRLVRDHLTLRGWNVRFVYRVNYHSVIFDKRITWRMHIGTITTNIYSCLFAFQNLSCLICNSPSTKQSWLMPALHGYSRQTPAFWNFSAYRTRFSASMVTFQGAHRPANCIWLSKFRIYLYGEARHRKYKRIKFGGGQAYDS